jgi:hypothetical protein
MSFAGSSELQTLDSLRLRVRLSDTKEIKARVVYDLVELVSEVSGFADILVVTASLFFAFYTTKNK